MNMIATNMLPTDEQLHCVHIVGFTRTVESGTVVVNQYDADLLDKFGGIQFSYCPICGIRFEEV